MNTSPPWTHKHADVVRALIRQRQAMLVTELAFIMITKADPWPRMGSADAFVLDLVGHLADLQRAGLIAGREITPSIWTYTPTLAGRAWLEEQEGKQ